jgi:hypothetical protein
MLKMNCSFGERLQQIAAIFAAQMQLGMQLWLQQDCRKQSIYGYSIVSKPVADLICIAKFGSTVAAHMSQACSKLPSCT